MYIYTQRERESEYHNVVISVTFYILIQPVDCDSYLSPSHVNPPSILKD